MIREPSWCPGAYAWQSWVDNRDQIRLQMARLRDGEWLAAEKSRAADVIALIGRRR